MGNPESGNKLPETISLNDEEGVKRILIETVFGMWDIVNNLTRLRPSRRERYRVTIFGSARTTPDHWVYNEVRRMAAAVRDSCRPPMKVHGQLMPPSGCKAWGYAWNCRLSRR